LSFRAELCHFDRVRDSEAISFRERSQGSLRSGKVGNDGGQTGFRITRRGRGPSRAALALGYEPAWADLAHFPPFVAYVNGTGTMHRSRTRPSCNRATGFLSPPTAERFPIVPGISTLLGFCRAQKHKQEILMRYTPHSPCHSGRQRGSEAISPPSACHPTHSNPRISPWCLLTWRTVPHTIFERILHQPNASPTWKAHGSPEVRITHRIHPDTNPARFPAQDHPANAEEMRRNAPYPNTPKPPSLQAFRSKCRNAPCISHTDTNPLLRSKH